MADERNERNEKTNGPSTKPSQPVRGGVGVATPPGGQPIDPRVRIGVADPNKPPQTEKEVMEGVSRELDQLAQRMAAGAGNTPEERAAMAGEIDALKQRLEDEGFPVPALEPVSAALHEERPLDEYNNDPKAEAHALAVQKVAAARDEVNASLHEDDEEGAGPKSPKKR